MLHPDPPDLHPGERRPPVEAHADERVAAQRRPRLGAQEARATPRPPNEIPEDDRDYYLERKYPSFGNLVPRDVASRAAKEVCDEGRGVGPGGRGVYLDFADAIKRLGEDVIRERYGNLFDMYERITGENPYKLPMRIYPAIHYTMGGLWVDYNLMSTIPGLFVAGEANFSDHGANRLGRQRAHAGPGRRLLHPPVHARPTTSPSQPGAAGADRPPGARRGRGRGQRRACSACCRSTASRTVDSFHRELGLLMWDYCGMARNEPGLRKALDRIPELREEFWQNVKVPGDERRSSTRPWRRPAASPTSSSWAS